MKLLAYFLPQYHEIEENNQWWGKGFTEWTNVKSAQKLYRTHEQPVEPYEYYDLLDKETMLKQTEMANKYGVYGFCYYHYWFEGRMLLEKPAENLLRWKDINQKFCFCWANHTWKKTWNHTNDLLIAQTYGDETEWQEHFEYLLKFFKDSRYIKIDNKPVFVVYDLNAVENSKKRFEMYDEEAKKNGFDGVFLIQSINSHSDIQAQSQNILIREPAVAEQTYLKRKISRRIVGRIKRNKKNKFIFKPHKYNYSEVIETSLSEATKISEQNINKNIFLGSFTAWDSTPRHGAHGYVIESTPKKFGDYLRSLNAIKNNNENIQEYVFINAWNEWAEGMYLEPSSQNAYGYLEEIKKIINHNS